MPPSGGDDGQNGSVRSTAIHIAHSGDRGKNGTLNPSRSGAFTEDLTATVGAARIRILKAGNGAEVRDSHSTRTEARMKPRQAAAFALVG